MNGTYIWASMSPGEHGVYHVEAAGFSTIAQAEGWMEALLESSPDGLEETGGFYLFRIHRAVTVRATKKLELVDLAEEFAEVDDA